MHLSRYISFWSRRLGDRPAIVCGDEVLSWAELDRASATLAAWLREAGVERGDRFGCLLGNSVAWCVGFFAAMRLGAIFVPVNAMFGAFELAQIAQDADCAVLFSCPSQIGKVGLPGGESDEPHLYPTKAGTPPTRYAEIIAKPRPWNDPAYPDSDVLAICYTSGTTGVPKGAMLTHRNVETATNGIILNCAMRGGDERFLILAPLAFTGGVISNLVPLLVLGATGYLEKSVDPVRALDLMTRHRISALGGVPALWERIAIAPGFAEADISELRMAVTGGAPVPRALLDTYLAKGVSIRQQYGFTEACGGVASYDADGAARNPGACGFSMPSVDIEIRDETGRKVAPGEIGEFHVRGVQIMAGYWNKPDLTAAAFTDGWYKSGDLGTYDEDGAVRVVDRKKNMLISGGVNIYPAEVERAMYQIEGVAEVAVLGIDSAKWGQEVAAIVHAPGLTDGDAIMRRARELLGSYKAPKHIALSATPLPKTASNKIARTGLVELFEALAPEARADTLLAG